MGLSPEEILKIGNASYNNAALMSQNMRGAFRDNLNAIKTEDTLLNSANMRNYRDMSLSLSMADQQLRRYKAMLEMQMAQAKNELERQKLAAQVREIDMKIEHNSWLNREIQTRLGAIERLRNAQTPGEINPGDLAGAGFKPVVPSSKEALDANFNARALLFGTDDEGNLNDTVRDDLTVTDLAAIEQSLGQTGQHLGTIELKPVEVENWHGGRTVMPGRKLYFIAPPGGLQQMSKDELRMFLTRLREQHDIDEDDPVWKTNMQKYFSDEEDWVTIPRKDFN